MVCERKENDRYPTSGRDGRQGGEREAVDMGVLRIVPNIAGADLERAKAFYREVFDLDIAMDLGWIVTFASDAGTRPQISVAREGGSGTPVPDVSIEVEDVDQTFRRAADAGHEILYGVADEPWGVRRFYMRDPFGKVLNVLSHAG
jgi:predicted enzyme related to lactoylglutathione lyase